MPKRESAIASALVGVAADIQAGGLLSKSFASTKNHQVEVPVCPILSSALETQCEQ